MKKILLMCFIYIFAAISTANAVLKAASEVVNYSCSSKEDNRIFCVDEDGKPLTGKIKKRSGDKYTSIENYLKGYRNGLVTIFNNEGGLLERVYYKQGIKNGMDKIYYPNRSIWILANYNNGLLNGRVDVYDSKGKLMGRMHYNKGILDSGYCRNNQNQKTDLTINEIKSWQFNLLYNCGTSGTL